MVLGSILSQTVTLLLIALGVGLAFLVVQVVIFSWLCKWADRQTDGNAYYGKSLGDRRRFKKSLSRRAKLVAPLLWLLSRGNAVSLDQASFEYEKVSGPKDSCSEETYARAAAYEPTAEDVFVVTPMKCGTTWMQHLVYQILNRGRGDLVESGRALYGVSPWIEARKSVSMEAAPRVGSTSPRRLIKTHLPTSLCPYDPAARYIYVVRHPVSCFASTVDFIRTNLGPFDIPLADFEAWFCSDKMWWSSWPEHVSGWQTWAQERPNVMFVRFEDMKRDLDAVANQVAEFLGEAELSNKERQQVVRQCSFAYMRDNAEAFEMSVPNLLQCHSSLFVSGKIDRRDDVPADVQARILAWCRAAMEERFVALEQIYRDAAAGIPEDRAPASSRS